MVSFGHSAVDSSLRDVPDPRYSVAGLHTMHLRDLYRRQSGVEQTARHRVPVHLLALVTAGRASFSVDFARYPCRPGGLIWVRPGQFVGFPPPGVDATLVLFDAAFPHTGGLPDSAAFARWAAHGTYWQPTGEDEEAIVDAISQLEIDYARIGSGEPIPLDVLRHQLAALLLRIARLEPEGGARQAVADSDVLARFRRDIEQRFTTTRHVDDFAKAMGCSVRTLTRASLAATGRTAKQLIDERVALEAKRLLAESDLTVADIGARLGFSEPTNFGRFFARIVGRSPGQFRAEAARQAAEAGVRPDAAAPAQPLAAALAKGAGIKSARADL